MLLQILHGTPNWVFVLFAALLALGLGQLRTREVVLGRVVGIALGMTAFSLYSTMAAFGRLPLALAGWLLGAVAVVAWLLSRPVPAGTRYQAERRRFTLPGSVVPLTLMMTIFFTKYAVAVAVAMHPALSGNLRFALPVCLLYGTCSGAFAARAARLWRLTRHRQAAPDQRADFAAPAGTAR